MVQHNKSTETSKSKEQQQNSRKVIQESSLSEEELLLDDLSRKSDTITDDDMGDSDYKLESQENKGKRKQRKRAIFVSKCRMTL